MRVSIVINTLNRAAMLKDTLTSLLQQSYRDIEIIPVRGPCTDNTDEVLQQFKQFIKVRHCDIANLSVSRNIGIAAADGDVIAFLDDDAVADARWIERLVKGYSRADIAAVGGWVWDHTGTQYQCRYNICDRFARTLPGILFDSSELLSVPGSWYFPSTIGTNSSFRADYLREVGGFDEAYMYNCDETDVCLRLVDAGYVVRTVPDALVYHRYAASHLRDHRRIPTNLYPAAFCKGYFAFRNTLAITNPREVFKLLAEFQEDLTRHNRWFLDHDQISAAHFEKIEADVERGIREGMNRAVSSERVLLTVEKIKKHHGVFESIGASTAAALKIGLLTMDYPPGPTGGIGRWSKTLAIALSQLGHEVHVFTLSSAHDTVDFEEGVFVHRVRRQWHPDVKSPISSPLPQSAIDTMMSFGDAVKRSHEEAPFDIVSTPIWELPGLVLLAEKELPIVLTAHSAYASIRPYKPDWSPDTEYGRLHVDLMIAAEQWAWRNVPAAICNSDVIMHEFNELYGVRRAGQTLKVVHGIPPISSEPVVSVAQGGTKSFDHDKDQVTIVYVGRLEKRKGIDLLLAAIPAVVDRCPRARFVIVGEDVVEDPIVGSHQTAFQKKHDGTKVGGRVTFAGHVSDRELVDVYQTCNIFVAPSRFESFGLIFIEAMAHGKPVVALSVGGALEIIRDGVDGVLVSPDDSAALADALARLVENDALRRSMGENALGRFESQFTAKKMAQDMVAAYRRLIDEGVLVSGSTKISRAAE